MVPSVKKQENWNAISLDFLCLSVLKFKTPEPNGGLVVFTRWVNSVIGANRYFFGAVASHAAQLAGV